MISPLILQIVIVVILLILGFTVGSFVERAHFARLAKREAELNDILVTDVRTLPRGCTGHSFGLVTGEVVIASDYFKTFTASLRKLVGGELRTYESLMERARREALVRLKQSARNLGATHVANIRFATSSLGSTGGRRRAAMVEMYAYGTAVCVPDAEVS